MYSSSDFSRYSCVAASARFSRFSIFSFGIKNLRNNILFLLDAAAETVMSACILFLSVFYFTRSENIIKKLTRRHPTDTQIM